MSLSFSDDEVQLMISEGFSRYLDSPAGKEKVEKILNAHLIRHCTCKGGCHMQIIKEDS